jgi:hypothetical protein
MSSAVYRLTFGSADFVCVIQNARNLRCTFLQQKKATRVGWLKGKIEESISTRINTLLNTQRV